MSQLFEIIGVDSLLKEHVDLLARYCI